MIPSRQRFARAVRSFIAERKRLEGTMDIVKKLRNTEWPAHGALCDRAADEIERLRAAIRSAHKLIDNDLVVPWIIAHNLDDILSADQ